MFHGRWIVALLLLGVVVWFVAPGGPAPQADAQAGPTQFVVTSVFDGANVDPGDGLCESAAGTCTLRAALQEANLEPGTNVVLLQAGTYSLGIERDAVHRRRDRQPGRAR